MTNITEDHKILFKQLRNPSRGVKPQFALFSCFVNGEPASAIVKLVRSGASVDIIPVFVSVTPSMVLTDHEGKEASCPQLPSQTGSTSETSGT